MGANSGWAFAYALFATVLLPIPYYVCIPLKVGCLSARSSTLSVCYKDQQSITAAD